MAESIFKRMQRVISAGAESATDALERASGPSLLRQAVREIERAADEVRARRREAGQRRQEAARQVAIVRDRLAGLDEQARFAIQKGRADLAEAAISRQLDYEAEIERLKAVQAEASDEAVRLDASLAELEVRKAQMEKDLAAFQPSSRAAGGRKSPEARAERRARNAEATFDRVMAVAGGPNVALMDVDAATKVAEVQAMRRDAEIEKRLAALGSGGVTARAAGSKPRKASARKPR